MYLTDLSLIATNAAVKEPENERFRDWLNTKKGEYVDSLVHEINDKVAADIDCTLCGNCCSKLIINVEQKDLETCSAALNIPMDDFKEKYLEESLAGKMYINTIPCHFLQDKKCTIYENRFTDCREFPHLHKPGLKERLLGTLLHFGHCPIVYNVIEELKVRLGFEL